MTLDESNEKDEIFDVEGIKVLFEKDMAPYTKGFKIDYRSSIFGKRFVVDQLYSSGSCR